MPSPMSDLLERRVPQWTAVYIGAGWGLVQFIAFMEERYLFSPHWTDLCLLTLGLLLPSVILYTYNHGRPGVDRLQASDKVGIPANVAIAAMVVWFVFGGKDLGAMTTAVTVTTSDGTVIERELPKAAYRRRLAVFDAEPSGSDTAWAGGATTLGLLYDLAQDSWIDVRFGPMLAQRLREAGFEPGRAVPLTLKREVASDMSLTHFVVTRVNAAPPGYRASFQLYDVATGRLLAEHSYAGLDLMALADSATAQLRRDMDLPAAHLDEVEDLPVAERLTREPDALRAYARGAAAIARNDWNEATRLFGEAVDLDSTFAAAAAELFQARLYTSDHDGAMAALRIAIDHIYRLPERVQFFLRAGNYQMQQQNDRAIGVLEMAAELYPDDIQPRVVLASLLPQAGRELDAIRRLEEVLRIDPGQVDHLLAIGMLYRQLGEQDSALAAYARYVEAAPDRPDGPRTIGQLYAARGDHERAREQFERALLLDPGNVDVMISIAGLARDVGDFAAAEAQIAAAETTARAAAARFAAIDARADLLGLLGRPAARYNEIGRALGEADEFMPPMIVAIYQMSGLKPLAEAGLADEAQRALAALAPRLAGIFSEATAIGALSIETGRPNPDPARIEAQADRVADLIASLGWEMLRPTLLNARGLEAELRGDFDAALEHYGRQLELEPSATDVHTDLGRAHRLRGDLVEAARQLHVTLGRRPVDPEARVELALVHEAAGRSTEAVAELRRALDVWSEAEPDYAPAARARAALDRLLDAQPSGG